MAATVTAFAGNNIPWLTGVTKIRRPKHSGKVGTGGTAHPAELRFATASSRSFFIKVWSGLQQISQRSQSSSGSSWLPPLLPLVCTWVHPKLLSASRRQQSQTKVFLVPMATLC